jgi:hypothetical protein
VLSLNTTVPEFEGQPIRHTSAAQIVLVDRRRCPRQPRKLVGLWIETPDPVVLEDSWVGWYAEDVHGKIGF